MSEQSAAPGGTETFAGLTYPAWLTPAIEAASKVVARYSRQDPQEIMTEDEMEAIEVLLAALPHIRAALRAPAAPGAEIEAALERLEKIAAALDSTNALRARQIINECASALRAALQRSETRGRAVWVTTMAGLEDVGPYTAYEAEPGIPSRPAHLIIHGPTAIRAPGSEPATGDEEMSERA